MMMSLNRDLKFHFGIFCVSDLFVKCVLICKSLSSICGRLLFYNKAFEKWILLARRIIRLSRRW